MHGLIVGLTGHLHGFGSFPCRDRLETDKAVALRIGFGDDIVCVFIAAADGHTAKFIKISMKLQDHGRTQGDMLIAFVNGCQNITITGNFLFVSGARGCFVQNDLLQAFVGSVDAFNFIGSFRTLDLRNLHQLGKGIAVGFDEKILLAFELMDLGEQRHNVGRKQFLPFILQIIIAHNRTSLTEGSGSQL